MKEEWKPWEMKAGEILVYKKGNKLYDLRKKQQETKSDKISTTNFLPDKGRKIGFDNTTIFENVYNEFKEEIVMHIPSFRNDKKLLAIIKKYYGNISSANHYKNDYVRFWNNPKRIKERCRKHNDIVGYVETYKTWIKKSDIKKIKVCLHKYSNIRSIGVERITKINHWRTIATLHFMKEKGMILLCGNKYCNIYDY